MAFGRVSKDEGGHIWCNSNPQPEVHCADVHLADGATPAALGMSTARRRGLLLKGSLRAADPKPQRSAEKLDLTRKGRQPGAASGGGGGGAADRPQGAMAERLCSAATAARAVAPAPEPEPEPLVDPIRAREGVSGREPRYRQIAAGVMLKRPATRSSAFRQASEENNSRRRTDDLFCDSSSSAGNRPVGRHSPATRAKGRSG